MTLPCPRRAESAHSFSAPESDHWREDGACSYCGSLSPEILFARLEKGDVEIIPTDKSYKIYVRNAGGEPFKQTYRTDSKPFAGWDSPEHDWVTRDVSETKFYFQHVDAAAQQRFIDLYNAKKMKIGFPGYFYTTPFFCSPVEKAREAV